MLQSFLPSPLLEDVNGKVGVGTGAVLVAVVVVMVDDTVGVLEAAVVEGTVTAEME